MGENETLVQKFDREIEMKMSSDWKGRVTCDITFRLPAIWRFLGIVQATVRCEQLQCHFGEFCGQNERVRFATTSYNTTVKQVKRRLRGIYDKLRHIPATRRRVVNTNLSHVQLASFIFRSSSARKTKV